MPSLNAINLLTQATALVPLQKNVASFADLPRCTLAGWAVYRSSHNQVNFWFDLQTDLRILGFANYAALCKIKAACV